MVSLPPPPPAYWVKYDNLFKKYATQYQIPWQWLKAIAINESDLGRDKRVRLGVASRDGKSWGLMQLTVPTASEMMGGESVPPEDLNFPYISIQLAAKYVATLCHLFKGNMQDVVMAYNQGPGNQLKGNKSPGVLQYYKDFERHLEAVNAG